MGANEDAPKPMTLVVALFNQDEIVLAGDTLAMDSSCQRLSKPFHKLKPLGRHVFSASGASVGFDPYESLLSSGLEVHQDIHLAAGQVSSAMYDEYAKRGYDADQTANCLLAGFGKDDQAMVYCWKLPTPRGPCSQARQYATVGAPDAPAICFLPLFHREEMTTDQRIQLAHFCLTRAGFSDVRVGDPRRGYPIDIVRVTIEGIKVYAQDELRPFIDKNDAIVATIASQF